MAEQVPRWTAILRQMQDEVNRMPFSAMLEHEAHLEAHRIFRKNLAREQERRRRVSPNFVVHHSANILPQPPQVVWGEMAWLDKDLLSAQMEWSESGYATRVPGGTTPSVISSGPIDPRSLREDAAAEARPRLRRRSPRSGDPLKHWKTMRESENRSPTSTDSPAEKP